MRRRRLDPIGEVAAQCRADRPDRERRRDGDLACERVRRVAKRIEVGQAIGETELERLVALDPTTGVEQLGGGLLRRPAGAG